MDFGIGIATSHDSWKLAQRAEALGFTHAWFYDTQMITADCFVAMGAAAMKTSKIRLGTGVLVPSNRIAAVTANAFATLNAMAPGRLDFGVGTGFSARRAMGLGSMKLADMEEYIRVVYGLLAGDTLETSIDGYIEIARRFEPADARYLMNHRGHFVFVKPEEQKFVDAELIRRTTFTATEQELKQRIEALRDSGWNQFVMPIVPGQEHAIEDWARIRKAFV